MSMIVSFLAFGFFGIYIDTLLLQHRNGQDCWTYLNARVKRRDVRHFTDGGEAWAIYLEAEGASLEALDTLVDKRATRVKAGCIVS